LLLKRFRQFSGDVLRASGANLPRACSPSDTAACRTPPHRIHIPLQRLPTSILFAYLYWTAASTHGRAREHESTRQATSSGLNCTREYARIRGKMLPLKHAFACHIAVAGREVHSHCTTEHSAVAHAFRTSPVRMHFKTKAHGRTSKRATGMDQRTDLKVKMCGVLCWSVNSAGQSTDAI
jgi:hypothetical protein